MPYVHQRERVLAHHCNPPPVHGTWRDWDLPETEHAMPVLREGVRLPVEGDVWACPTCDKTWVCYWKEAERNHNYVRVGTRSWRPEKKRERRRRIKKENRR